MLFPLIGLLIGLLIGTLLPVSMPVIYSSYLSIAILAALNSVFGGIHKDLKGKFDQKLFITGFFGNTILAALLTYIGDRIGLPIYFAAIFYFGTSLFSNFASIRRHYFQSAENIITKDGKNGGGLSYKKIDDETEDEYEEEIDELASVENKKNDTDIKDLDTQSKSNYVDSLQSLEEDNELDNKLF